MGLFSRKPKVRTEDFCRAFYDNDVFNAKVGEMDAGKVMLDVYYKGLVEADSSFGLIERPKFDEELKAVRLELFSLVWMQKFPQGALPIEQSMFTRRYLDETGRLAIWHSMLPYNQALAQSVNMGRGGNQMGGRLGRGLAAGFEVMRLETFKKWCGEMGAGQDADEEGRRAECFARAANRLMVDIKKADCVAIRLLAARLADRLGCDSKTNDEVLFRLAAYIFGFYAGAQEALKSC